MAIRNILQNGQKKISFENVAKESLHTQLRRIINNNLKHFFTNL